MIVYADSSFLVSLYVRDSHSPDALQRLHSSPRILATPVHQAELANALRQCVFRASLTEFEAMRAWKRFAGDVKSGSYDEVLFPDAAWITAVSLSHRFCGDLGVRTLDTLHVASALELRSDRFWTFDDRQARLAEAVGLDTTA